MFFLSLLNLFPRVVIRQNIFTFILINDIREKLPWIKINKISKTKIFIIRRWHIILPSKRIATTSWLNV